jgi:hypothetical protein
MKCPKCGTDVPEGASFCINCGATVGEGEGKIPSKAAAAKKEKPETAEPKAESKPEPEPEKPTELAASEAPDELPGPDRKLEEAPPKVDKPPEKTEKPYRDYRKPITAVIFIIVIVCSIFACCAFCVLMASMQGYY